MKILNHPKLLLEPKQHKLIKTLVKKAKEKNFGECSWLGFGKPDQDNEPYITIEKIVSPEQENSSAESDMDEDAVHKICMAMLDEGLRLIWWGHSHADMDTFFSGTDLATWKILTDNSNATFFATVHNYDEDPTYDRLKWKGMDLEGSNQLLYITTPTISDEELKEHTDNWKKPEVYAGSFAYTHDMSPLGKYGNANYATFSTAQHDGESSLAAFRFSPELEPGNKTFEVGHICESCKCVSSFQYVQHQKLQEYECDICGEVNKLPRSVLQSPANHDRLAADYRLTYEALGL